MLVDVLFMLKLIICLKLVVCVVCIILMMLLVGFDRIVFLFWNVLVCVRLLLFCMNCRFMFGILCVICLM